MDSLSLIDLGAVGLSALSGTLIALKVEMKNIKERLSDVRSLALRAHRRIDKITGS